MTATNSELNPINRSDTSQPCWISPCEHWTVPITFDLRPCTIASVFITFSVNPSADKWIIMIMKVQPFILSSVLNHTHKPQIGFWQIQLGFPTPQQIQRLKPSGGYANISICKQAGAELSQAQAPIGWPVEAVQIKKQILQSKLGWFVA